MSHAVEIENVTKSFAGLTAVSDVSLTVPRGSIYGFIGPNGSGKTTTLRMIVRIFAPDAGHIRVLGEETWKSASDRVAYLPEERGLYKQMKVGEMLTFYGKLKGMTDCRREVADWLERMQLSEWADKKVEALSKGMSQKVQFIATVMSRPELVLLDEPFSGLDPVNGEVLREAVVELKKQGTTVIFSTHDMAMAERMCDRIFMIFRGRRVLDGTLEEIQDSYGSDTLRVRLDTPGDPDFLSLPGVEKVTDFNKYQELRVRRGTDSHEVLAEMMRRGRVRLFEESRPSLQDIFVRIAAPEMDGIPEVVGA